MFKFIKNFSYAILILVFSLNCDANPTDYRNNTALVIIDMQTHFAVSYGYDKDAGNQRKFQELIKNQIEIIKLAKASHIPIIFIEYEGFGDTNEELKKAAEGYDDVKYILKDTEGMLTYYNNHTPELLEYLSNKKIGNLIIAGANGGACVQESITSALDYNFNVIAFNRGTADFNYPSFIYPYLHPYKFTPGCENCKYQAVMDLKDIARELKATRQVN